MNVYVSSVITPSSLIQFFLVFILNRFCNLKVKLRTKNYEATPRKQFLSINWTCMHTNVTFILHLSLTGNQKVTSSIPVLVSEVLSKGLSKTKFRK